MNQNRLSGTLDKNTSINNMANKSCRESEASQIVSKRSFRAHGRLAKQHNDQQALDCLNLFFVSPDLQLKSNSMVDQQIRERWDRQNALLQEVLSAHNLTHFEWALLDGLRWCVDDALEFGRFIAKNASLEDGYHYNIFIGEWTDADVVETVTEFLKKGYYTRVSKEMAEQVVRERFESEGCEDVSVDDLVGNYVLTECGLAVWTSVSLGLSRRPFAQFMSQPDVRWIFRGAIPFSVIDVCTAKRENPKWSICADLNCKLDKIGPWADPGNCVMPSGWRLTCFRRYVDESKYKANKSVE